MSLTTENPGDFAFMATALAWRFHLFLATLPAIDGAVISLCACGDSAHPILAKVVNSVRVELPNGTARDSPKILTAREPIVATGIARCTPSDR
jgi:hypothetical protein